jgi:translocation and assembly module TamB
MKKSAQAGAPSARIFRFVARGVLITLAALVLLLAGAVGALQTPWGARLVLHQLTPRLNAQIRGHLDVASLSLSPTRIVLSGLSLRDPAGSTVATVATVAVDFSVWKLLHHEVRVWSVAIVEPRLALHVDETGQSNLARATAGRRARSATGKTVDKTAEKPGKWTAWAFRLDQLTLQNAELAVDDDRVATDARWRTVRLSIADARLDASLAGAAARLALNLELRAALREPFALPLHVALAAKGAAGDSLDVHAGLTAGTSHVDLGARAQLDRAFKPVSGTATIERIELQPSLLRHLLKTWPLQVPVEGSAGLAWNGETGKLRSQVKLAAGGAAMSLTALGNLQTNVLDDLSVAAKHVDLARLIHGAPSSNLSLDGRARARGTSLGNLEGSLTVQIPRGAFDGRSAGPIRLAAQADHGRFRLTELLVSLPGATLTAAGQATGETVADLGVAVQGAVDLEDLHALWSSVAGSGPAQPQGSGRLTFSVGGTVDRPSLRLGAHLERLAWNEIAIPSLQLALRVPDLRRPVAADLTLSVPEAKLGARRLAGLSVRVRGTGPRFAARLALSAPEPVALSLAGTWTAQQRRLTIRRAQVGLARATWALQRPATLVANDRRIRLTDLALAAAPDQSIRMALDKTARGVDASVSLSRLDLAGLPQRMLSLPRLAGRLTADVDLHQSREVRRVKAHVALAGGRIGAVSAIDSTVDVQLLGHRATANLAVKAIGAQLRGQFDLPAAWPPTATSPISADLDLASVDLERITRTVAEAGDKVPNRHRPALRLGGQGTATIRLRGTAGHPQIAARARATALRWQDRALGDLQVEVDLTDAMTSARLSLSGGTSPRGLGTLTCDLRTETALPSMIAGPPSWRVLAALPFQADFKAGLQADRIDLGGVGQLLRVPGLAGGTASMSAQLAGNLNASQGRLDLTVDGFAGRGIPPTDAELQVIVGKRDVRAQAQVSRRRGNQVASLVTLKATVGSSLAGLLRPAALSDTALDLKATLGPLAWQHAGVISDVGQPRLLRGHLQADLEVAGTVARPQVTLVAKDPDIRLDEKPAGAAEALLAYRSGTLTADLDLVSASGNGRLLVNGSLDADLSYPAVLHLPPTTKLPINLRVQARQFDLAPLSGLAPVLRTVAGQVEADLQISGTVADPRPAGRLEWKDGRLVMIGIGDLEKIHFLVHGDRDQLTVDELRADSGSGHAKLTVTANHRARGGYQVRSSTNVDKFPVYVQGQSLANVSLQATADAEVSGGQVRSNVHVSSTHLALSDAKRKHLQSLSQPGDVILVEDGTPIDKVQAQRLAQAEAELQRRPAPPATATATATAQSLVAEPTVVLLVDAPRGLWISGNDANLEIGLEPGFRVEIGSVTRVYGQVIVKRGHVDVLGRRFDLKENSSLRFSGPPDRPTLDVTAQFVNAENSITVVATVKGPLDHLQTTLSAPDRPDLTETQLYTLIITGHLTFAGGSSTPSTPTSQAESLLGGLLASQLQTLVSNQLPFDVLTIQTGATAGSARVEAGKYLTSDLYVGYVGRIGADPTLLQNRNAVHFEYDLGSRWSFQGEYGDAKTGSLDLFWTKRY